MYGEITTQTTNLLFLSVALQPESGLGFLTVEVSRSHTTRHTYAP